MRIDPTDGDAMIATPPRFRGGRSPARGASNRETVGDSCRRRSASTGSEPVDLGTGVRSRFPGGPQVRDASDSEDLRYVAGFLSGDESAFAALFEKYREKVYGVAFRFVKNRDDALEVTQEVFLRVYKNLAKFQTNSRFFTWLYRIAVNRSIDFTRSRKNQPLAGIDTEVLDAQRPPRRGSQQGPVERAQERELEEILSDAVESLSEKHQAVFVLHAAENLSYREIARVLDCNIGTVMSRLYYARKRLQERLRNRGVDLTGFERDATEAASDGSRKAKDP